MYPQITLPIIFLSLVKSIGVNTYIKEILLRKKEMLLLVTSCEKKRDVTTSTPLAIVYHFHHGIIIP